MSVVVENERIAHELALKASPENLQSAQYLASWHLEHHSFLMARKYLEHLARYKIDDKDITFAQVACSAMLNDFEACKNFLKDAAKLTQGRVDDIRIMYCEGLMLERQQKFDSAIAIYVDCLRLCDGKAAKDIGAEGGGNGKGSDFMFIAQFKGDVLLRLANVHQEKGCLEAAMEICERIAAESHIDAIKANAMCIKAVIHEKRAEFPSAEVLCRSVLQINSEHTTALDRLGRMFLRFRETVPAAVQCFFKLIELNSMDFSAWYLLGRCYMATAQYDDAWEAYSRSININPNFPPTWCSIGVLYYACGQYREGLGMFARALKLEPTRGDAWYNVGALYDMCNHPVDAEEAYIRARAVGQNEPLADEYQHLGDVERSPRQKQHSSKKTQKHDRVEQFMSPKSTDGAQTTTAASPRSTSSKNGKKVSKTTKTTKVAKTAKAAKLGKPRIGNDMPSAQASAGISSEVAALLLRKAEAAKVAPQVTTLAASQAPYQLASKNAIKGNSSASSRSNLSMPKLTGGNKR
jgi:tetratricopeptide (TPR) repeat protein